MPSGLSRKCKTPSETETCYVCGAPAVKYLNYGATACFSCRAFFRRTVQSSSGEAKPCRGEAKGECVIDRESRKSCPCCRFKKCLGAGMNPGWVLTSEERAFRFRKRREKQLLGKTDSRKRVSGDDEDSGLQSPKIMSHDGHGGEASSSVYQPPEPAIQRANQPAAHSQDAPLPPEPVVGEGEDQQEPLNMTVTHLNEDEETAVEEVSPIRDDWPSKALVPSRAVFSLEKHVTSEEIDMIQALMIEHDRYYKSVSLGEDLIKQMILTSAFGIKFSAQASMEAYRVMVQRVARVAHNLHEFYTLPTDAQSALLKHNTDLIIVLRGAVFFQDKKQGLDQILISLGIDDISMAKRLISATSSMQPKFKHIDYVSFNTIQVKDSNSELEKKYDFLMDRLGTTLAIDSKLTKLVSLVLFFDPNFDDDSLAMAHKCAIANVQEKIIVLLRRYLSSKYDAELASTLFGGLLSSTRSTREMIWIKKQRMLKTS